MFEFSMIAAALIAYGAGNGLNSIARGSLPLALFGPARYPVWTGRVATPTLIAGALAPLAEAVLIDTFGSASTLRVISTLAAMNVPLVLFLIIRDTNLARHIASPRPLPNLRSLRVWSACGEPITVFRLDEEEGHRAQKPNFGDPPDLNTLISLTRRSGSGGNSASALRRVRDRMRHADRARALQRKGASGVTPLAFCPT
jgi:hypothetical protein